MMPQTLEPNRWKQVEGLFYAALELPAEARAAFVQNQSEADRELIDEVMSLLAAEPAAEKFLAAPVGGVVREVAAEQTLDRLRPGGQLAHYEIQAKIGAGGMGQVYRAMDLRLRRPVALKVLAPYLTHDEAALRRFEQEAHAASALNHPNILTVFEFGESEGLHYIATELIEGPTLRSELQPGGRGRFEIKAAVPVAVQIASALAAAHGSGIVHRDIKPENILIRGDGLVKLVDFGIAKLGEGRAGFDSEAGEAGAKAPLDLPAFSARLKSCPVTKPSDGGSEAGSRDGGGFAPGLAGADLTLPGMVVGTLRYMSPEQARREPVDGRSDLFSVGAVLYEMLAGAPAFQGESQEEIARRVLEVDPPPLAEYGVDVPVELELIVEKALRKEKDERYQTSRDLLVDLQQFQRKWEFEANLARAGMTPSGGMRARAAGEANSGAHSAAVSASSAPVGRRWRPLALSAGVLLAVPLGIGGWLAMRDSAPAAGEPRSIAVLPFENLNGDKSADFLSVSLADALIAKLGYVKSLTVRPALARTDFRAGNRDRKRIASDLRVDLLLTGSYRKEGNNLEVATELFGARRNAVLWRGDLQIPYDQLLTLEDKLTQKILGGLSIKLSAVEAQSIGHDRPVNTVAYEYYLRGVDLYALNEFAEAIDALRQSIANDPGYAPAWAQLGRAYTTHASLQFGGREQYALARQAYDKALSLDPGLVDARIYMANLLTDTGRAEEAVPLLKEALEADPNSAEAHWELGYAYRFGGLLDESAAEAEQARRLDPEVKMNSSAINAYLYRGEYKKFLDSLPAGNSGYTLFYRGLAQYYLNDLNEAENDWDRGYLLDKTILPAPIGQAMSDGLKHRPEDGLKLLRETEARFDAQGVNDPEMLYKMAQAYAMLGDSTSALRALEKSADGGFFCAPFLAKDPLMNSLRGSPKFCELQGRIYARFAQFRQRFGWASGK